MSSVAAPSDRRFRRAHVKPARARRSWRALVTRSVRYALAAVLFAYAVSRVPRIVADTHILKIDPIHVHGNSRLSEGEVLALLSGLRGQSLIWADLAVWRQRLLSSPWVKEAQLRRSLPSTIDVFLSEKEPIGLARIDGRMYLTDDRGVLIDEYGPQYAQFDLPVIDGLSAPSEATAPGNGRRVELASQVIAALRFSPDIAHRLSQVDVRDLHDAAVILSGDAAVIQLGDRQFLQRLQSYLEVAPALRERVSDIDQVDVRFDGRIYVKPMGKASRPVMSVASVRR